MQEYQALALFEQLGAIIKHGHFVYASGRHGDTYINKDALYPNISAVSRLCKELAVRMYTGSTINTVIGPAMGGVILSQWVAYHLTVIQGFEAAAIYAEKSPSDHTFVVRPSFYEHIRGKRILVVEDQLTTGASAAQVVQAVRKKGGNVIGLGALWNRGGVTENAVGGVPAIKSVIHKRFESWSEDDCPLCLCKSTVNTKFGHGQEFINRKKALQT